MKKILLRVLALLMVLLMVLPVLFACGETPEESKQPESTKAPEAGTKEPESEKEEEGSESESQVETETEELPADYLEDLDFTGTTLTFLAWDDYTMQEFTGTGDMGNEIDSAIYLRNKTVAEKLGVEIEYVWEHASTTDERKTFGDRVAADYDSGAEVEFDIYASYSRMLATLATRGYNADLLSMKHFNFDASWWPQNLIDESSVGGKLFFASGDISTNLLWMITVPFFNKALLAEHGIDEPYQLVLDGKWTADKLKEMTSTVYEDLNNNLERDAEDFFGFAADETNVDIFATAAGIPLITKDENGRLIANEAFKSERMETITSSLHEWFTTSEGFWMKNGRNTFMAGNALFTADRLFIGPGKDSTGAAHCEFDYGVVPAPMYEENSDYGYCTNVGHPFTMFGISVKTPHAEAAAATLELMAAESYRYVTPAIFEIALKLKYSEDSVDADMYDIIRNTVVFEVARLYCDTIGSSASNIFRKTCTSGTYNFTSIEMFVDTLGSVLTDVNISFGFAE